MIHYIKNHIFFSFSNHYVYHTDILKMDNFLIILSLFCSFYSIPDILTKWAFCFLLTCPFINAVGVIGMITRAPRNRTSFSFIRFTGLTLQTRLIYTIFADSAVFYCDIPTPKSNCIPLFYLDSFINFHSNYYNSNFNKQICFRIVQYIEYQIQMLQTHHIK